MKKILFIAALSININVYSQTFKDGNYTFTVDYLKDLNSGEEKIGINKIILQSSLNKIILNSNNVSKVFQITSKEVSHDGITAGDMEYRAVMLNNSDSDKYLFVFKHKDSKSYSINISSLNGLTWWELHITKTELNKK